MKGNRKAIVWRHHAEIEEASITEESHAAGKNCTSASVQGVRATSIPTAKTEKKG